jgi:hypothetical protein
MRNQFLMRAIGIACVGGIALAGVVSAQATRGDSDRTGELLAEVRGLRAELTQVAGASMRMQLLLARLSLQEQRIAALNRASSELQQQLTAVTGAQSATVEHLDRLTAGLQSAAVPPEERKAADFEITALKSRIAEQQQEEQRLQNQLVELSSAISAEQGRWIDFNSRLDELERSLPAPTRR